MEMDFKIMNPKLIDADIWETRTLLSRQSTG